MTVHLHPTHPACHETHTLPDREPYLTNVHPPPYREQLRGEVGDGATTTPVDDIVVVPQ